MTTKARRDSSSIPPGEPVPHLYLFAITCSLLSLMSATRLPYLRIDTSTAALATPLARGLSHLPTPQRFQTTAWGAPRAALTIKIFPNPTFHPGLFNKRLIELRDRSVLFIILQIKKIILIPRGKNDLPKIT